MMGLAIDPESQAAALASDMQRSIVSAEQPGPDPVYRMELESRLDGLIERSPLRE